MPTLSWLTREIDVKAADAVPYRLLEREDALSFGETDSGNMLIQGDNLEALKSLLPYYRGAVKCIYIDPPYNTRSAFEHYDDNLEHSRWLAMIWPRLELLRELLAEDGSIWVSIDDNEGHYLKVVMDEMFGRRNFVATVVWQKIHARNNTAMHFSDDHDFKIVFAKNIDKWKRNKVPRTAASDAEFWNPDDDPRGRWRRSDLTASKPYGDGHYEVTGPHGDVFTPRGNRYWSLSRATFQQLKDDNRLWWGKTGRTFPFRKRFESELGALVPTTIWLNEEAGNNREAKLEVTKFSGRNDIFSTPKPERLIERILHIATAPGDLVLDSFLGSGTTTAVAHKMGRRWIGVEMGEHADTHCAPRMRKVVEGEQGGISKAVEWNGGGGFAFYRLGQPVFDANGAIAPAIGFAPLASHIWFSETGVPMTGKAASSFLGAQEGQGIALLYNGILGDKRVSGGNVLTRKTLAMVRSSAGDFTGPITIYGEASRLGPDALKAEDLTFKQTPYDVRAR